MIPLLSFLAPRRLWLLVLIPLLVVLYLWLVQRKRSRNRTVGRTMFDLVIPRDRTWLRHVAVGLSIFSLLTLTLAFAKPKDQVSVPRERATIVVTIDVSLSMEAQDVEPNRLDAAKIAAEQFVNSLPPKFNVALVSFAGTAMTLVPPTLDRGAVTAGIQALRPQASTAIGEGIYTSLAALAQVPPDPDNPKAVAPARIVLLSDGKTQVGRASDEAAQAARAQSVPIYTIAYGTADGYIEIGGRREPVPVDRAELRPDRPDLRRRGLHRDLGRPAERGLQGHRQFGRYREGRQGGHLALRRPRPRLRDPGRAGALVAGGPLAVNGHTRKTPTRVSIMGSVAENLAVVRERVDAACRSAGRDPAEVRLLPVSKTHGRDVIAEAYEAGVRLFGENRVQEAAEKAEFFADRPDLAWAIIGHLQTNKAKLVATFASEFHALDSIKVAEALERRLHDSGRSLDVFIQVNSSGEPQKFGLPPEEVEVFARKLEQFGTLQVRGLMTLAVFSDDQEAVRACFQRMQALQARAS